MILSVSSVIPGVHMISSVSSVIPEVHMILFVSDSGAHMVWQHLRDQSGNKMESSSKV